MILDVVAILALIFFACVLLCLFDWLGKKFNFRTFIPRVITDNAKALWPVFLMVLLVRAFVVQTFHVPTGSLQPTIKPGDYILVNQFVYGLHLPLTNQKIKSIGKPQVGDLVVFHWPKDLHKQFIKRVIATPGDHVTYVDKKITINDQVIPEHYLGVAIDEDTELMPLVQEYEEDLLGSKHNILINPQRENYGDFDLVVPAGNYFVLGDNRDNSGDSREWGFLPEKYLIGKAFLVWMSWDSKQHQLRWRRIGKWLA